ncbi:MAG: hypothetical protein A3I01_04940 [Betaproteobacteria bacterium RIFCSPLOWO2_02_FULL_65_24]|nr:MAG: hypothetical protein A3I01_04940 [Betaproteobacteria bacterium RIFCSPLOWO2_02_FULL_65_24]
MTRKQFLILVAALAALAAAGAWIMQSQRTAWGPGDSRIGQRLVAGLKLEEVAEVALRDASATLTLVRRDGTWVIKERADFSADAERVRELLLKLVELKIVQAEPVAQAQRARLELAEPGAAAGTGAGTLLELKDGTGKTMARLLLGKKVTARTAAEGPSPEQGVPTGRYVMPGTETGSVALVSDPLGAAEAKPDAWLSKDLIRAERVRTITASGPDGRQRFSLSRETESYDWKLAGGGKPDLQKAQDALNPLQGMSLSDVVPDSAATGLDRPIVIRAQTLDGVTYTLRVGSKTAEDRYFISISVNGELAAARTAGKSETAEEKEKQDKAFAENRARLLEKLEREKKLERWTYLVARTAVEPLLRERAQLLPQKKAKDSKKP